MVIIFLYQRPRLLGIIGFFFKVLDLTDKFKRYNMPCTLRSCNLLPNKRSLYNLFGNTIIHDNDKHLIFITMIWLRLHVFIWAKQNQYSCTSKGEGDKRRQGGGLTCKKKNKISWMTLNSKLFNKLMTLTLKYTGQSLQGDQQVHWSACMSLSPHP